MTVAELRALLEQLPDDAVMHVGGDEFVPPNLEVQVFHETTLEVEHIRLMDPVWGHVDHVDGRVLR